MLNNSINTNVLNRVFNFTPLSYLFVISSTIIALVISVILTYLQLGIFILPIVALIPLPFVFIKYPKIWIYSVVASLVYFLSDTSEGVSVLDVLVGGFYIISLFIWFIWQMFFKRNRIVYNISDWLILFLVIILPLNFFISFFNNVEPLEWLKEYVLFVLILYYFPVRHYITEKKDVVTILVLFVLIVTFIDFYHFYTYLTSFRKSVVYAYQISMSIGKVNQTLFTSTIIPAILFTFYIKNEKLRIVLLMFATITILALLLTFSRTFWLIVLFESFIIFLYINRKEKIKFILYFLSIILISISVLYLIFQDKFTYLNTYITKKFTSSTMGTRDVSVVARLLEYKVVLRAIEDHPLGGNGFAKKFTFNSGLDVAFGTTNFIHNGYFYLAYRAGIPIAILYVFVILYNMIYPLYLHYYLKDKFAKNVAIMVFLILLSIIISDFTTPQFFFKEGYFIIAILIGFNGFCKLQFDKEQKENNLLYA